LASRLLGHVLKKVFAVVLVIVAMKIFMTPTKPGRAGLDNSMIEQKTANSLEHGETNNASEI
jgi:uncharacterized membrane protein YfcA